MGTIKDRNGRDLTEAEDIKKRWQEYTEELYKKDLHDPDNHDGVITHLEPDILECEVKWALGSITMDKVVEVEFQLSYFKSWKMMLLKCCTQYTSKFGKLSSGHRTGKGQFHSSPKERQCQRIFKLPHSCTHFTCQQSNNSKFFKLGFNRKLSDVQAGFRKGRGTRDQIANIRWIIEKNRVPEKYLFYWLG